VTGSLYVAGAARAAAHPAAATPQPASPPR